jgi:hypothetical protein
LLLYLRRKKKLGGISQKISARYFRGNPKQQVAEMPGVTGKVN